MIDQEQLNNIIIDWITKEITAEEAMARVHKLSNVVRNNEK